MRKIPIHWQPERAFAFEAGTFNLAGEVTTDGARVQAELDRAREERERAEKRQAVLSLPVVKTHNEMVTEGFTFDGEASYGEGA